MNPFRRRFHTHTHSLSLLGINTHARNAIPGANSRGTNYFTWWNLCSLTLLQITTRGVQEIKIPGRVHDPKRFIIFFFFSVYTLTPNITCLVVHVYNTTVSTRDTTVCTTCPSPHPSVESYTGRIICFEIRSGPDKCDFEHLRYLFCFVFFLSVKRGAPAAFCVH